MALLNTAVFSSPRSAGQSGRCRIRRRPLVWILLAGLLLTAVSAADTPAADPGPMLHFSGTDYFSPPVLEGQSLVHDFGFENRGTAPLLITRVQQD